MSHSTVRSFVTTCSLGLLALGAVTACNETTTPTARAPLTVLMTDAPFPYDSVERVDVYVVRIDARQDSVTQAAVTQGIDSSADQPGTQHGGWTTIATPNQRYNLLDLQHGNTANLGQLTLPTGQYKGFRLILNTDSSSVTLKDGTVLDGANGGIVFPSAGRTGIKIDLAQPISLTANGSVMVLDFNLAQSFVQRGRSLAQNGLLFKPVIRATAQDLTGSLSGSVMLDSASGAPAINATVDVLKAGTALTDTTSANVVASTKTDSTGAFKAAFVLPGTYTVRASVTDTTYAAAGLDAIVVQSGQDTGNLLIVLPKKWRGKSG